MKNELGVGALIDGLESDRAEGGKVLGTSPKVPATIFASLEPGRAPAEPGETFLHGSCGHSVCAITNDNAPGLVSAVLNLNDDLPLLQTIKGGIRVI